MLLINLNLNYLNDFNIISFQILKGIIILYQ